jgi:hypothetical protein
MTQSESGSPQVTDQASQLSAMFDDALPAAECELLARRVSGDPALQQQWGRYAMIGAALRGDPICARPAADGVAARVRAALAAEAPRTPTLVEPGRQRWAKPLLATGIAAGVAALSLVWLQRMPIESGGAEPALVASVPAAATDANPVETVTPAAGGRDGIDAEVVLAPAMAGEPDSYVVPALPASQARPLSSAQLANFVVAHSEFSGSLSRRSVLSALVAGDDSVAATPAPTGPVPAAAAPTEAP